MMLDSFKVNSSDDNAEEQSQSEDSANGQESDAIDDFGLPVVGFSKNDKNKNSNKRGTKPPDSPLTIKREELFQK